MIKSPLRYPGGKSRAIKFIAPLIPHFHEYREPFLGGGSVFLYLKQQYPDRNYWVNDLYPSLFHFWTKTQQNTDDLMGKVWEWKSRFEEGKVLHRFLLDNREGFDDLEKAAAFFIFNRITFSGTSESGGFSKSAYDKRFTPSSMERLKKTAPILHGTRITNLDYWEVVAQAGEEVFIFLDPPYYSATKSALYGKNGSLHKAFDHERFARALKNTTHRWLITYDDSPYIRRLFSFARIKAWHLTYGMRNVTEHGDQNGKELFISNYALPDCPQKPLLFNGHGNSL